ncbi:MAG: peptide-methionine (R)-S-oxide reductase, partial [Flavobacteriaceae bacterium]|nr:peptide-methionine (R)-S-oxide reductase [Flavobacteriaceae bacterium]
MKKMILLLSLVAVFSCKSNAQKTEQKKEYPVSKSDSQWKAELTEMQYYVLRQAGTERAFSSPLNKIYEPGTYVCAACETPLFESENKFDSGTGWPSFDREIEGNVEFSTDYK